MCNSNRAIQYKKINEIIMGLFDVFSIYLQKYKYILQNEKKMVELVL